MKTTAKLIFGLVLTLCSIGLNAADQPVLAFPGAQGWGRFATGGRTGTVYHVTNLNDTGAGSLRDAVSQPNRIVVFDVAGVINIKSRMVFSKNLYVAGQTAPGEGITVYGDGVSFSGAENIIVRYMRFRMGHNGSNGKDCAGIANGQNMIFDHCSFAWGLDETFSINPDGKGTTPEYITLQNCIVGQGLMTHSAGGLMQTNYVSLIGNFLCDNNTRNFKVKGINQYANNMIYNWGNGAYIMGGDSEGKSYVNIQSNLFINGPAKGGAAFTGGNADFHCYGVDNWQDNDMDGRFNPFEISDYNAATREPQPYDYPTLELNPGRTLLDTNLPTVGASLPYRDPADCYMVDEVLSFGKQGALISNEETLVYGAPSTWKVYAGKKRTDTDGDGMPDEWEQTNGTDPARNDAMKLADNGYANIENYINGITAQDRDFFLRTPVALELTTATTTTLKVSWRDYTFEEEGFAIEVKKGDNYEEVGRTGANATSFTITGLEPGTKYNVRVRAFVADKASEYTTPVEMSTRPVEVGVIDVDSFQPDYTWTSGDFSKGSADGKNILLAPSNDGTLTLDEAIEPIAIVYQSPAMLTVSGTGSIGGAASVNKAGEGILSLQTTNTYTGATVVHEGVLEFSTLKNGGEPSSIGASVEFAQNWILDGGTCQYTGSNTTTNRSAKLTAPSVFNISKATVTMNGTVEGADAANSLTLDGNGQLTVGTNKFFGYKGATILKSGKLYLSTTEIAKAGIGSSSKLVMKGGHLQTKGESSGYETYAFPMEVVEGTTSQLSPNRNCYITSKVIGAGTLQLNIPYLREYVQGDWSGFTGRLIANGVSTDKRGSLLLLDKQPKLDKTVIELKGNANLCYWSTNGTQTIGGISGSSGTYINGSSKQTDGFTCTWTVGSANTDETFRGSINNWSCSGSGHTGTVSIVKTGTGLWRLTGTNDYKGTTTVNGGLLIINGKHTGTGAVTVNAGAALGGKGTIAGAVTIKNGGILWVGDTLTTDKGLTFSGGLKLEEGAILQLNEAMIGATFSDDTAIRVFTGKVSGQGFSQIEPAQPSSTQKWDTSELLSKGVLYVRSRSYDPVGVKGVEAAPTPSEYDQLPSYSLSGRQNRGTGKGLYIRNGKKHIH
jgi:autotransporter-associated beta strand protein